MKRTLNKRAAAGLTGAATLGLLALGAVPALAAAPYGPPNVDEYAVGTVSLYDSTGAPVVGGSTTAPYPTYSVGSATAHAGDNRAIVELCTPVMGQDAALWNCDSLNGFTPYPVTTAPAVVANAKATDGSAAPVSTELKGDLDLDTIIQEYPNNDTSSDGYAGLYELRVITTTSNQSGNTPSQKWDDAYISVNSANNTYTIVYPAQTTPPPALPEAPLAIGLPLVAVAALGGAYGIRRRRRSGAAAV